MKLFNLVSLPLLTTGLVGAVNILTELCKRLWPTLKPKLVVTLWAELLSLITAVAAVVLEGWISVGAILAAVPVGLLAGLLIAYTAMFGYDELYEAALNIMKRFITYLTKGSEADDESI